MKSENMPYLQATLGQKPDRMPIVIEIQSVTSPSNQKLREKYSFSEIMGSPELSSQCTVNPVTEVGYDAAIHVSDLLVPFRKMGFDVTLSENGGPSVSNPVRCKSDVEKLSVPDPSDAMKVWLEAMRISKKELCNRAPLIGWVGGPMSTGAFLIEGQAPSGTKAYHNFKTMMHGESKLFHSFMEKLTAFCLESVSAQVNAGADVIMILDLGAPAVLSPEDYREFCFPYVKRLAERVKSHGVPLLFACDGSSFLKSPVEELSPDIVAFSWTLDIADVIKRFDCKQVVQGNLEPYCLFESREDIEKRVKEIVKKGKSAPAHIFSLGGWIVRNTPFETVKYLVDLVHSL